MDSKLKMMKAKSSNEDRKKDDSDENSSNSDDGLIKFLFKSALDVGSTFLKIIPEEEDLVFYFTKSNSMEARIYLENTTPKAAVAYLAWTSNQAQIDISPKYGFIRPGGYQYVTITLNSTQYEDVEKGLFFIKALPLYDKLDIDELEENIDDVFHENNRNILFTIAMLSGSYDLDERAENKVYDYHTNRDNLKYTEDYVNKEEEERHLEDVNNSKTQTKENNNKLTAIEDFDIPDNVSKSHQRESDLLGINDEVPPKRTLQDGM